MFFKRRKNRIMIQDISTNKGKDVVRLVSFNGDIRNQIVRHFQETIALEGDPIGDGGKASPVPILSLLGAGGGALGISAAASGSLFMATANPATLMAIGGGVGSAVMGASGIVAQAPFVAVSGAILPVVAPLVAYQALTSIMILNEFKLVNKRLIKIQKSINKVLERTEATFLGEVISACSRLQDLEDELSISSCFSNEMILRLALIESKVNSIFERYRYLYESQPIRKKMSSEDISFKQSDAYMTIILSILDLRIDTLRLKLDIQENPGDLSRSAKSLVGKVDQYRKIWSDIEGDPKRIEEVVEDLRETVNKMNLWKRNVPEWLGGKKSERKKSEEQAEILTKAQTPRKIQEITKTKERAERFADSLEEIIEPTPTSLIYWEDYLGKHSYYTNDLELKLKA